MRICIANDPRAYREVIAAACRALRPHHDILVIAPDDLDAVIATFDPALVICSRFTSATRSRPITWIVLYPEGESLSAFSVGGGESRQADLDFERIIALIDETERLLA